MILITIEKVLLTFHQLSYLMSDGPYTTISQMFGYGRMIGFGRRTASQQQVALDVTNVIASII